MTAVTRRIGVGLCLLLALALGGQAGAQDTAARVEAKRAGYTGLPLPRFVSLRAGEVNLRTGPGIRYPIDWVYRRRGLPVEVVDEFETWRRIRDHEGTSGWVHQSMLNRARNVLVTGDTRTLRRAPDAAAPGVAQLEPGVLGHVKRCESTWCRVEVDGHDGWLLRDEVFGLYPEETIP